MAQDTFGKIYKQLLLRCPDTPLPLAQDFVKTSYRRALDRNEWGALRARSEWQIPEAYTTGTASVTLNSASVTGTSTVWTSSMVGRQFKVGNGPFYTIATVPSATSLTLDRVFAQDTDTAADYSISLVYVTPASDVRHILSVIDPENRWMLNRGYTTEFLDAKDPQRVRTGPPRVIAGGFYNSSGLPLFELWPRSTSAKYLPYTYIKEVDLSTDADQIIYPMGGEAVLMGALYELSKWPGTLEKPNPYFNLSLANEFQKEFEKDLGHAIRQDQSLHLTDFYRAEDRLPYAPIDLDYMRNFDPLGWGL